MSNLDVAIPAAIGLLALLWPQAAFLGSRVTPDAKKLRTVRIAGAVLLVVAIGYLAIGRMGA